MKTILFLLLGAVCGAAEYISSFNPALEKQGLQLVTVGGHTHSMGAALAPGQFMYIDRQNAKDAKVGDIVGNGWATHRVTAANKRAVYTSGDANRYSDGWTLRKDLKFVVKYIVRP